MPNTFTMQEIIRTEFDQYLEDLESGKSVKSPLILSISKGKIP